MNLYLLSQDFNDDYDTYDACIVAAKSAKAAKIMKPYPSNNLDQWASPEHVKVEYIGKAKAKTKAGVILASFNAG